MDKKKILVIFGANSNEHEVSVVSGSAVYKNIDEEKYIKDIIYLDKENKAYKIDIEDLIKNVKMGYLPKKIKEVDLLEEIKNYDLAFPVIHGGFGEDGKIQKILEGKIPYVGCSEYASKITFDKSLTKKSLKDKNIKMAKDIVIKDKITKEDEDKLKEFIYPVFIKASRSGSSVGVYRAVNKDEAIKYINEAFKVDSIVLVEEEIKGIEVEVAVLQKCKDMYISDLGVIIPDSTFYTYDSKYNSAVSETRIIKSKEDFLNLPDRLKEKLNLDNLEKDIKEIKQKAKEIFIALRCKDLSRIDFFLTKNGYVFNEINTMPGFTSISMYPKLISDINEIGSFSKILEILIENNLK